MQCECGSVQRGLGDAGGVIVAGLVDFAGVFVELFFAVGGAGGSNGPVKVTVCPGGSGGG